MTESYCVIADIAGEYKTFLALLDKMPKGYILSVGDVNDRGSQSKEVIEWFMKAEKEGTGESLLGNHETFIWDTYESSPFHYSPGVWQMNGGNATLKSFGGTIPREVIEWIKTLKTEKVLIIEDKTYLISHAFKIQRGEEEEDLIEPFDVVWNRRQPEPFDEYDVQIAGHNSQFGLKYWVLPNKKQAICIDTSASKKLTGIHLPTMKIYQQEYL